jgi:hypothetical protein
MALGTTTYEVIDDAMMRQTTCAIAEIASKQRIGSDAAKARHNATCDENIGLVNALYVKSVEK